MKKSIKNLGNKVVKYTKSLKGGETSPLHQCAQVVIQVDLGELADVEFN